MTAKRGGDRDIVLTGGDNTRRGRDSNGSYPAHHANNDARISVL